MNLMKTEEMKEKKQKKIKGVHFQNCSYPSSEVLNSGKLDFKLMLRHSTFTKMVQFITHQILTFVNIDENMRNKRKIEEN